MKQILLTQGKIALVADADYDWLNQWKWYVLKDRSGSFYAVRSSSQKKGKRYPIYMHRLILGLERGDKREGDHRNHNTLDNRRSNLRICTQQQNLTNQKPRSNGTSKYKGVTWDKHRKKWYAQI